MDTVVPGIHKGGFWGHQGGFWGHPVWGYGVGNSGKRLCKLARGDGENRRRAGGWAG